MSRPRHAIFAGGGTAGHLFPGLAVAEHLRAVDPGLRITFAGSGKSFEHRQVTQAGFSYVSIPCRPLPRRAAEALGFVLENFAGYLAARRLLITDPADLVVGLGGFASVAVGRAALRRGVPLMLLEQNAYPGRATSWLAGRAKAVCLAMPQAAPHLPRRAAVRVTGNPIRGYFAPATTANRQLAVLGGSGGARSLNQQAPLAIYRLKGHLEGWRIVHQTGEADVEATRLLYGKLGLSAQVTAFVDDMPTLLAASSVALCRAGGTTLAELAAAEVPSVLVPYPHATSDHQRRNAEVHAQAGGAMIVDERDEGPLPARLAAALGPLVAEPRRRERMAWNLRQLARPGATREVASLVVEAIDAQWERAVLRCA